LALRHVTPHRELRSNLRLLGVNLLQREPANEKSWDAAAARRPVRLTAVNLLIPFAR
jgi:hypothetical protein